MGSSKSRILQDTPNSSAWLEMVHPEVPESLNGYIKRDDGSVIPLELLEKIFTECSLDEIRVVAQVCRLWKDVTVQMPFWKLMFAKYNLNFESIPPRIRDHNNAWIVMRTAIKKRLFGRNLIRNHSGELGTFEFWDRDCIPGLLGIESPLVACSPLPADPEFGPISSAFVCSHDYYSMSQRIDLWREGLTPPVMEIIGPFEIRFSLLVGTRHDCGGIGHFNAVFGEHIGPRRLLCELEIDQGSAGPWKQYSFAAFFENSNPRVFQKVRYIEFAFGGKDNRFWQGHYGLKFARASMKIKLLSDEDLETPDPHYHRLPITFISDPLTL